MADENKRVNVRIPADRASGILAAAGELSRYRESENEDTRQRMDAVVGIMERRIAFFEKLSLLAGGSFALSITFVSSLRKHEVQNARIESMVCLKVAWVLMLACIALSWIHNWYRSAATDRFQFAGWGRVASSRQEALAQVMSRAGKLFNGVTADDLNLGEFFDLMSSAVKVESKKALDDAVNFVEQAKVVLKRALWIGNAAFLAMILAFVFLFIFAIKNMPLL